MVYALDYYYYNLEYPNTLYMWRMTEGRGAAEFLTLISMINPELLIFLSITYVLGGLSSKGLT